MPPPARFIWWRAKGDYESLNRNLSHDFTVQLNLTTHKPKMKILLIITRSLLGLVVVVFGLNAFLQFIPAPPPQGLAGDFVKALFMSKYFYVVAILQIAGGALLLLGRFV